MVWSERRIASLAGEQVGNLRYGRLGGLRYKNATTAYRRVMNARSASHSFGIQRLWLIAFPVA